MAFVPISFRIAQAVGITGAAWLSGNIASLSLISVPALIQSGSKDSVPSPVLAQQWKYNFEKGKSQNPPIAAASASAFSYLAWSVRSGSRLRSIVPKNSIQLYTTAAILTLGIVPYTLLAMQSTNSKLIAKSEAWKGVAISGTSEDAEFIELVEKWTFLNGVRSSLPLAGAIAGFIAVLAV
ncbi:hypothetical protein OIDMADRAFT_141184 [Oidiodendron maius Zn]|uniref:DUF1772 domain-containing protein n=1 Tax=Oidiodendron maius (strain Zn) TaxID=913774 RepID=A0A0C3HLA0_OIDMZ|nr:hypothetical protein OIDMADRAFT_141184 [Oidiodendron maius Zn]